MHRRCLCQELSCLAGCVLIGRTEIRPPWKTKKHIIFLSSCKEVGPPKPVAVTVLPALKLEQYVE